MNKLLGSKLVIKYSGIGLMMKEGRRKTMDRNSLGNQQITKIIDQLNQAKTQTKSGKMLFVKKKIVFVSKAFE